MQLLWMIFLAGLAGGFGHCIGMCGGIVAACSFTGAAGKGNIPAAPVYQALYHSGRIATYGLLGGLFGAAGSLPMLSRVTRPYQSWLAVVAGVLMVVAGVAVALGWDRRFTARLNGGNHSRWFIRKTAFLAKQGTLTAFPLGLLMGFLPCGMLSAIELRAIATGSAVVGASVMVAFGLGTLPGLLGFGIASGLLSTRVRGALLKIGAIAVVVIGILTIVRGIDYAASLRM